MRNRPPEDDRRMPLLPDSPRNLLGHLWALLVRQAPSVGLPPPSAGVVTPLLTATRCGCGRDPLNPLETAGLELQTETLR